MSTAPAPGPTDASHAARRRQLPRAFAWLAILALVFLAGDRLIAAALRAALPHSRFRFSVALQPSRERRVLIMGDSRPASGIVSPGLERRLNVPVFNLSFNYESPVIAEALLRGYLDHNPPPRLLVLELDWVRADQSLIHGLMCYWDAYPGLGALADRLSPVSRAAARISHLYAFDGEVPMRAWYFWRRSDQDMVKHYRMNAELLETFRTMPKFEMPRSSENLAALGRIVRLAHARGIPIRLLLMPYLPIATANVLHWDRWMASIQRAVGPEERIWDYRNAIQDPGQFADWLHLNDVGVAAFEDRLVRDRFFAVDSTAASAAASGR